MIENDPNRKWDVHFNIPLVHLVVDLQLRVKNDDICGAELIGTVKIPAKTIASEDPINN